MDTDDSDSVADSLYSRNTIYLFDFRMIYLFLKKIMS